MQTFGRRGFRLVVDGINRDGTLASVLGFGGCAYQAQSSNIYIVKYKESHVKNKNILRSMLAPRGCTKKQGLSYHLKVAVLVVCTALTSVASPLACRLHQLMVKATLMEYSALWP